MLNELYPAVQLLANMGVTTESWHREYKLIPKTPCMRLWVANDGTITRADQLPEDIARLQRKFGNNQGSFPAFNLVPLFRLTAAEEIKCVQDYIAHPETISIDTLRSLCTTDNWQGESLPDLYKKTYNCLKKAYELLDITKAYGENQSNAVTQLLQVTQVYYPDAQAFRQALANCIFTNLEQRNDPETYLGLLFHLGDATKAHKNDRGGISLTLDLDAWRDYGTPVASKQSITWINQQLLANTPTDSVSDKQDAFGDSFTDVNEPMPNVKLRGFDVTLRAMFSAQQCQFRYHEADDASYPVSRQNRLALQGSLEWLSQPERFRKTWQIISKDELLYVFPSKIQEDIPDYTSLFTNYSVEASKNAAFIDEAEALAKTLQGLPAANRPDALHIFSIRKMDKARTKVMLNRTCTPEHFFNSAEAWQAGCQNLPDINLRYFPEAVKEENATKKAATKEKAIPVPLVLQTPFPLNLPPAFNNVWRQDGTTAQGRRQVTHMQPHQGIEFLIDNILHSTLQHYMHILVVSGSGLIQFIGDVQHREQACNYQRGKAINNLLCAIALLNYKAGYRKENYMKDTAYLTGQLLRISDELHAQYCQEVRSGEIPPQLAGNAMFVAASECPAQAIAQLSVRMVPYIAWAKKRQFAKQEDSQFNKARWYLSLYEKCTTQLAEVLTPQTRLNDFEKSQLFIGYLASLSRKDTTPTEENITAEATTITE